MPKFNPGKREPSPLLTSKLEGSVVDVKSTTLTESGTDTNNSLTISSDVCYPLYSYRYIRAF